MNPLTTSAFDLPDHLAPKAAPALIAADEQHFAALAESLRRSIAELSARLDAERRAPGGEGQAALDRDLEIHRLSARLGTLRRFGLDLCLGRVVGADAAPVYVGRLGLTDSTGRRLLVDWRSPAAEPFFAATHANPMGLVSRRRYRWTRGRITDYWDEVFTPDGLEGHAALDDQSASLTVNYRTPAEVMAEAEPVIRAALPDANVPTSIRSSGVPVRHGPVADLHRILDSWRAEHADGVACVIGDPTFRGTGRVRSLSPVLAKGLEFDLVVLTTSGPG
ncbi:hypothetical protein [Blastococcus sp. SYSU DS0539]